MLHDVYLYGELGKKYGSKHTFDIVNAPQAAKAMAANFKEFYADFKDGLYQVIIGRSKEDGMQIDKSNLNFRIGDNKSVHIIPVIAGAGGDSGGVVKTIIGITLITASFFVDPSGSTASFLLSSGIAMTASGVATLLTPTPRIGSYDNRETPDRRASFLFNGPTNRSAEGSAVPIVYGRIRTGSVVISAGIQTEQI